MGKWMYNLSNFIPIMTDEYFMMLALKEARIAYEEDEIPIGAVVVLNDPTAHAEMIALTSAFNYVGGKYLPQAFLYVTVEPCLMCAGAMYWGILKKIIWGADDEKNGYKKITAANWPFHPKTEIIHGILKDECGQLMSDFFKNKR